MRRKPVTALIAARPLPWDVPTSYLNKQKRYNAEKDLAYLRKINTGTPLRETLTVDINGEVKVFTLGGIGQGDDYFHNGMSLITCLETHAALGHSKVSIY